MLDEERLTTLLERHFDEILTADERVELDEIIQASPRARELFWEHARINAALRGWGERTWGAQPHLAARPVPRARRRTRGLVAGAAVAATLVAIWFGAPALHRWIGGERGGRPVDVAVVMAARDARWAGAGPTVGEAIGPRRLRLDDGEVALGFSSGAELVVRGPADLAVRSDMRMEVATGRLAVRVPPEAEGFAVKTPSVDIIDLGTEFGVATAAGGVVDVRVFEGSVETRAGVSPAAVLDLLTAGMGRRFLPGGESGESPVRERAAFPPLLSDTKNRPTTSGAMRLLESAPAAITDLESNEFILLYREAEGIQLPAGLKAEVTTPGIYSSNEAIRPQPLLSGKRVDSYLMHFRSRHGTVGEGRPSVVLDGSVTFPRPIVGVACWATSLRATDPLVTTPAAAENDRGGWGLEFNIDDHVVLSTDRQTLWVSLLVDTLVDRIRIFVEPGS